jgi:hypothetical protein
VAVVAVVHVVDSTRPPAAVVAWEFWDKALTVLLALV